MPLYPKNMVFTSESVTEGHPDKFCDQVADAIVDECLRRDPSSRVECDAYLALGTVVLAGEVTSAAEVNLDLLVRDLAIEVGYNSPLFGFDVNSCTITRATWQRSADARTGHRRSSVAANGQGVTSGYACNQTPELMPLPVMLANRLAMRLAESRKKEILPFLGPDGKVQVSVEYEDGKAIRVDSVAIATQYASSVVTRDRQSMTEEARQGIVSRVVTPVLQPLVDRKTRIAINGGGNVVTGRPLVQSGATGRKGACDTYGGWAPWGGATFSGRDPRNIDRVASYMARCVAKSLVAAGLADECLVQFAYCFGRPDPIAVAVTTFGTATGTLTDATLSALVRQVCPLSPGAMADYLRLTEPGYRKAAAYGHFGRPATVFPWERTELADELLGQLMKA